METEFVLAFLNSTNKTVINSKYDLHIRSGWVIESIDAEYVNIYLYSPLSGSSYIELPNKLKNSMNVLIVTKNNDNG